MNSTQDEELAKTKLHNVSVGEVDDLNTYIVRNKIGGDLENEAVTLTDIADGPPEQENKPRLYVRQSFADQNEVEMQHVSVGQSTAFGGNEEYELNTGSRINFMADVQGISGPRTSVPLKSFEYSPDEVEQALRHDLNCYQYN